jgi:hypothetical protein
MRFTTAGLAYRRRAIAQPADAISSTESAPINSDVVARIDLKPVENPRIETLAVAVIVLGRGRLDRWVRAGAEPAAG